MNSSISFSQNSTAPSENSYNNNKENEQQYELFHTPGSVTAAHKQQHHLAPSLKSHHQSQPHQTLGSRTPLGKVLEPRSFVTPRANGSSGNTTTTTTASNFHSVTGNHTNNTNNSAISSLTTPNTSRTNTGVKKKTMRSSLSYVLVTLQSLFKSTHTRESKILSEIVKSDHTNPTTWYKMLTFLFYHYGTPTSDYDDMCLHESRYNLYQQYRIVIGHIMRHRDQASPIDEHLRTLYLQKWYLMYLMATSCTNQPACQVTMDDLKRELKMAYSEKLANNSSIFYSIYMLSASVLEKAQSYLTFARTMNSQPEHIINDFAEYLEKNNEVSGFNLMKYFEAPEPVNVPATPMTRVTSLSLSPPTIDVTDADDDSFAAPSSMSHKRPRVSIEAPPPRKVSRTEYGSTPGRPQQVLSSPFIDTPAHSMQSQHSLSMQNNSYMMDMSTRRMSQEANFFYVNNKAYKLIDSLGKGGSSKVYRVFSPEGRIVALKVVDLKDHDKQTLQSFVNEVQLLQKLRGKPNIIELKDYELQKDYLMIVMECGDLDLSSVLRMQRGKALPPNQIRLYCQQMLEALNTIHEQRIVHSDLKPANFLFVKGQLKLIDFGIAKQIRSDTTNIMRDSQIGTVNYIPPEAILANGQATAHARGPRYKLGRSSDLWSFGCIVYQMIYGSPPFASLDLVPKIHAITDKNYQIPYPPLPEDMDPNILFILKSTLIRNPNQRATIPQLLECDFLVPNRPGSISLPRDYLSTVFASVIKQVREDAGKSCDSDTLKNLSREIIDMVESRKSSEHIVQRVLSELDSDKQ